MRGIHNYYPVDSLKAGSRVVATFPSGPHSTTASRKCRTWFDGLRLGQILLPRLAGRAIVCAATATSSTKRFWIKLARFVSAGNTPQKRYYRLVLPPSAALGSLSFEAQLKGKDLLPIPKDTFRPSNWSASTPHGRRTQAGEVRPQAANPAGEWDGWYMGNLKLEHPGQYEVRLPIPGVGETR